MTVNRQAIHLICGSAFENQGAMHEYRKAQLKIPAMSSAEYYEDVPVGQKF